VIKETLYYAHTTGKLLNSVGQKPTQNT